METIIRGSNSPLIFEFDSETLSNFVKISAGMYAYGIEKLSWNSETAYIQDNLLIFPMSEADTLGLGRGPVVLDVKFLDKDNSVVFMETVTLMVRDRDNNTIMTGV